jgi:hypothetical protein
MADLMSHKEWMKLTYGGVTSIRSGKLKAVDTALAAYEKSPDATPATARTRSTRCTSSSPGMPRRVRTSIPRR